MCLPTLKNSYNVDVTSWFDSTIIQMMYICLRTMSLETKHIDTAIKIANFTLTLHNRKEDIGDVRTYAAAQKYFDIQKPKENIHNVPQYTLGIIQKLHNINPKVASQMAPTSS